MIKKIDIWEATPWFHFGGNKASQFRAYGVLKITSQPSGSVTFVKLSNLSQTRFFFYVCICLFLIKRTSFFGAVSETEFQNWEEGAEISHIPLSPHVHGFPHHQHPHRSGPSLTTDERTVLIIITRSPRCSLVFTLGVAGFRQMCNDVYSSL